MKLSSMPGIAVAAVGALTVSGLALATPAQAAGPDVRLLSVFNAGSVVSPLFNGMDSGVRLTAEAPAGAEVRFEVNIDPEAADDDDDWQIIGSGETVGDYRSTTWYPTDDDLGQSVALRVVATDATGTTYATRRNVSVGTYEETSTQSVALAPVDHGFFTQPYADSARTATRVSVDGTTSATDGTVELSAWRAADGTFVGQTDAAVTETSTKTFPGEYVSYGRFTGALDLTAFDLEAGDVVAFAAERDADTVRPTPVYEQTVGQVQAGVSPGRVGESAIVDLFVTDAQQNRPVVGAEVRRAADGSLVGYTGADGRLLTQQPADGTTTYYVNSTDVDAYEEGVDPQVEVTSESYLPVVGDVRIDLLDGPVFDDDEYADGDISAAVFDQRGDVLPGQQVDFRFYSATGEPGEVTSVITDEDGVAVLPFDPAATAAGEVVLDVRAQRGEDPAVERTTSFVHGEATLTLTPTGAAATPGGQATYRGRLSIGDDRLRGREVVVDYSAGTELVPGRLADAALLVDGQRARRQVVTTDRNGLFTVAVDDAAERPQAAEIDGLLVAAAGGADASTETDVDFGTRRGSVKLTLAAVGQRPSSDVLRVAGPASVGGESIKLFRVLKNGRTQLVTTRTLNGEGDAPLLVARDLNGRKLTTYVVKLVASKRVLGSTSARRSLR